ncbi:hypothetical protein Clacol_002780 [Clathrus columnatus]|uniref:ATP-dependent 6-phosphofructokinase n=1 Tax=Clathrus columnatus TaxID=1419009 RepID=A0AAV5A6C7_9AGAM|nr:hypothetical protein Clacol_002780 [Clathrus columnatus]
MAASKPQMKIAVLTSGGDSAGMNAVVRAVVRIGIIKGCETYIIREGYEGLVRGNTHSQDTKPLCKTEFTLDYQVAIPQVIDNLRFGYGSLLKNGEGDIDEQGIATTKTLKGKYIVRVGWDDVRSWLSEGGTLIGTARSKTFRTHEGRLAAARNLVLEGINALVVCGGDGSLTGADVFRQEWPELISTLLKNGSITSEDANAYAHLKIVGLVGSIDNDMALTDLTIGAPTALQRICEAIDNINSTAISHSRAFVLEVMGRHCGWLALLAAVSGGADYLFIPEKPPSDPWEEDMCQVIQQHRAAGKRKTLVIVAEGAHDASLNPIRAEQVKTVLSERLGLDSRVTTLGHTQRGGRPVAWDRILPTLQGVEAVNALLEATPSTPSYMIGMRENKIIRIPLVEAVNMTRAVAQAINEKDFEKAMSLRDPEFIEILGAFKATSLLDDSFKLPADKRLRIAIMHPKSLLWLRASDSVGAPAGGMNAATRAAARYCIGRGHTPLAIHNGFRGLLDDKIDVLSWLRVDSWMSRGGSELGTNRTQPDVSLGAVATQFQKHEFDALFLIGGFEAFTSLKILEEARVHYPAFHIPMVHLPATISNNVPLTEFSLGCDTSLNSLVDACDAIKQSASASRNRVFVVETQGGKCGYIATMGALAAGAVLVYTPEDGINLDVLRNDVAFLKTRFSIDIKGEAEGRLVVRNEQSSKIYTTEVISEIFKEEGHILFDSRHASLGHTLQGGIPSPLDRARAVRLSMKCMAFIESQAAKLAKQPEKKRRATSDSAAVITIQGSLIVFTPVREMLQYADMKNRRGTGTWWSGMKDLVEVFGGRTALIPS